MKKYILLFAVINFCLAAQAQNLVKNGNLEKGQGRDVPAWSFSESIGISDNSVAAVQDGKVVWGLVDYMGDRFLGISMPEPVKAHVWWRQDVNVVGGLSYRLSLQASGTGHPNTRGEAGVYFRNMDGSWGKYLAVPEFTLTKNWQTYTLDFMAPDNARSITLRLGVDNPGNDVIDVRFTNIVLIAK